MAYIVQHSVFERVSRGSKIDSIYREIFFNNLHYARDAYRDEASHARALGTAIKSSLEQINCTFDFSSEDSPDEGTTVKMIRGIPPALEETLLARISENPQDNVVYIDIFNSCFQTVIEQYADILKRVYANAEETVDVHLNNTFVKNSKKTKPEAF